VRELLLLAHRVPVGGAFSLNDLAGLGGRMDEVARVASTAFTLSNDLRRDTSLTILFEAEAPPRARRIRMDGRRLKFLNPDERSTAALLKNALVRSAGLDREVEASPGLQVGPVDPAAELTAFVAVPGTIWLTESGSPIGPADVVAGSFRAVLSDPSNPPEAEVALLASSPAGPRSLGPRSLRSSQCVDVLHHLADREAGPLSESPPALSAVPVPGPGESARPAPAGPSGA
jgi:tRNA (pseudouridine54-N1)-methyltransferase